MSVLKLGNNINTDDIIPAKRCTHLDEKLLGKYAFEHQEFNIRDYDSIEAGENFGSGSSREHAILALKGAGIKKITAKSFSAIFFRNAINLNLQIEIKGKEEPFLNYMKKIGGLINFNRQRVKGKWHVKKYFCNTNKRPMTISEKILAKTSGQKYVKPNDYVFAKPNLIMSTDAVVYPSAFLFDMYYGKRRKIKNRKKFVFIADHFIQINDIRHDARAINFYEKMNEFAKKNQIKLYDKISKNEALGICHILLAEKGEIRPSMFIVGTDSHTCTYGAFGAFSMGIGTTDLMNLLAHDDIWVKVPHTIKVIMKGLPERSIMAKDVILYVISILKNRDTLGRAIEFYGDYLKTINVDERITLCNMVAEAGAICGIIAADKKSKEYVSERTRKRIKTIRADGAADYEKTITVDISKLKPLVAMPYLPQNVEEIAGAGKIKIDKAYIGSCTGGKYTDIKNVAEILEGRKLNGHVKLFVVPATQEIKKRTEKDGLLKIIRDAGGEILPCGCGACINAGRGNLNKNEACVSAINRNFRGRSGHPSAKVYLASPRTVAISAVRGYLSDRWVNER